MCAVGIFWQVVLLTVSIAVIIAIPTKVIYDWNRFKDESIEPVVDTVGNGFFGGLIIGLLVGFVFGCCVGGIIYVFNAWSLFNSPVQSIWTALAIDIVLSIIMKIGAYVFTRKKKKQ